MTAQDFLNQAYRLDQRIRSDQKELERLEEMARNITSPGFEEHISSGNKEAPFIHQVEKIEALERALDEEINRLLDLKKQILDTINSVQDPDERMILQYRYIDRLTWPIISERMYADERTIRRRHKNALTHITMPLEPIQI